jgi:hypothetical protein
MPQSFRDGHVSKGDAEQRIAVRSTVEALSRRGLANVPNTIMSGNGPLDGRATELGQEFLAYLAAINA